MADMMDACAALRDTLAAALYPDGTGAASAVGAECSVFIGWPVPQTLQAALAAGQVQLSVFPGTAERNTTRYQSDWEVVGRPVPTLGAALSGQSLSIEGVVTAGNVLGLVIQGRLYVYAAVAGDTQAAVAAGLLAAMRGDYPDAAADRGVLILPASAKVQRVLLGTSGPVVREIRRQQRDIQISVWAPTPALRDAVARVVDPALSVPTFLPLADGSRMRVIYQRSHQFDGDEQTLLYRRDFFMQVEFALLQGDRASSVLSTTISMSRDFCDA